MSVELSRFNFWPNDAELSLGLYRFLYFGWLLYYFGIGNPLRQVMPQIDLWAARPGVFSFFPDIAFHGAWVEYSYSIWLFFLLLTSLGLFTQVSKVVAATMGFWILGANLSNGVISHQDLPHLLILLIFAASDCGQTASLDHCFFKKKTVRPSCDYEMPIFMLRLVFVLVFLSSGIAKLKNGGAFWFWDGNVSDMFTRANIWYIGFPFRAYVSEINVFVTKFPVIAQTSGLLITAAELSSPLMFFKRTTIYFLILFAVFQAVSTFTLHIDFIHSFVALYFFWIPGEKLHRYFKR